MEDARQQGFPALIVILLVAAGLLGVGAGVGATFLFVERGPAGPQGERGYRGFVGPQGLSGAADLEGRVNDVENGIADLQNSISQIQRVVPPSYFGEDISRIESRLSDLESLVQSICTSDPRITCY